MGLVLLHFSLFDVGPVVGSKRMQEDEECTRSTNC